ncbi:MAG TPA: hypothetical protein VKS01_03400 [Bryobacteraceae bacterium]|nr:hypothetical protein [Bryobacteraceae bacterium]
MRFNSLALLPFIAGAMMLSAQNCTTPSGSADSSGEAVAATANFTVGDGFITVTVQNTQADPRSAGQLLNGVFFTLSTGPTTGTLGSNSSNIRRVNQGGSFTDLGPNSTGWALDNSSGNFFLCVLCTDLGGLGPSHLLIGDPATSGTYASANRSIAGNRPHNPFDAGTATFLINVPGLSSTATVTGATFFFSTAAPENGPNGPTGGTSATGSCQGGVGVGLGD